MKKIFFLTLFFAFVFSCDKEEPQAPDDVLPKTQAAPAAQRSNRMGAATISPTAGGATDNMQRPSRNRGR